MMDIAKGRYWTKGIQLVDGCTPCSPGCEHCWSAAMAHRFKREGEPGHESGILTDNKGKFNGDVITYPERLSVFAKTGKPTVFAIWNDLFHEAVPSRFAVQTIYEMNKISKHIFLILTKRPHKMMEICNYIALEDMQANIWHGLTICNQQEADEKIPVFLQVPGKKYLSIEPMLGPIIFPPKFAIIECPKCKDGARWTNNPTPRICYRCGEMQIIKSRIDAVLLGGETGTGARPIHPDWVRSVRDQCASAGVPFFFKSYGAYVPKKQNICFEMKKVSQEEWNRSHRLLDGRTHDDLPWNER